MLALVVASAASWFFVTLFWLIFFPEGNAALILGALTVGAIVVFSRTPLVARAVIRYAQAKEDPEATNYVNYIIGKYLPGVLAFPVKLTVISDPAPNAFAVGRDNLVVTSGLLCSATEEELAGALGHEIAHLRRGDGVNIFSALIVFVPAVIGMFAFGAAIALFFAVATFALALFRPRDALGAGAMGFFGLSFYTAAAYVSCWMVALALRATGRFSEYKADAFSAETSPAAGRGLVSFLRRFGQGTQRPTPLTAILNTHPAPEKRIARLLRVLERGEEKWAAK